jgi:cytochrome P450
MPALHGFEALAFWARLGANPLLAARGLISRHGPLVMVHHVLGLPKRGRVSVIAAGARFNEEVLSDTATWRMGRLPTGGPPGTALERIGDNVVSLNGEYQTQLRRLVAAPMRRDLIDSQGNEIANIVEEEVSGWQAGPADLWALSHGVMRRVAVAMLFGGHQQTGDRLAGLVGRLGRESKSITAYLGRAGLRFNGWRNLLATADLVERCALDLVLESHPDRERDLVAILARATDGSGCPMDPARLSSQLPVLFGASYESCQTALTWTLALLAQHPQAALALARELGQAQAHGPIPYASLRELPWLDAVVKESMRLFPPAPFQTRIASHDTSIGGHPVPEGTYVMLSPFLTNRDASMFPEPDRFLPERWTDLFPSVFQYPVFSAGPRFCPGMWFGLAVVKTALAAIVPRFRISLQPMARIDTQVAITLRPRRTVPATLHPADGRWSAVPVSGDFSRLVEMRAS